MGLFIFAVFCFVMLKLQTTTTIALGFTAIIVVVFGIHIEAQKNAEKKNPITRI